MKLLVEHLYITLLIGILGWFISGDIYCIPSALIAGWFIDTDHLCDFFLYTIKSKKLNLSLILTGQYFKINNKIIVPFHSWELSFLLLLFGIFTSEHRAPFLAASLAHSMHLLQDQRRYQVRTFGYSLISRINRGFAYKDFCRDDNG
jgi:hypothetical protein